MAFDLSLRSLRTGDCPTVMALWRATEGLSLRGANSEPALRRYLDRTPGRSFAVEVEAW